MHFYSDANIFGMSEMTVQNFKFRKNYDQEKMVNFQKIFIEKSSQTAENDELLNMNNVFNIRPDLFSSLS